MLELLLAGNNLLVIPQSGPGSKKLLAGTRTNGWFGVVPANEMPSPAEITSGTGLVATLPQKSTIPLTWMKAVLNGKYVFFATTPFNSYSHTQLYNAGVVYGTDDNGLRVPTGSTATNQYKLITFVDTANKLWCFKLRLISTLTPNNPTATNVLPPEDQIKAGELYNLFSHTMASGNTPVDGVKWDKLVPGKDFYNDVYSSNVLLSGSVLRAAPADAPAQYSWWSIGVSGSWMPLLELLDPDVELIPPLDLMGATPSLVGATPTATSNAIPLVPPELTMAPQTERSAHTKQATSDTIPLIPTDLIMANHDEQPPHMTP